MEDLEKEVQELQAKLDKMEQGTIGYNLMAIEVKEKEDFVKSLKNLI